MVVLSIGGLSGEKYFAAGNQATAQESWVALSFDVSPAYRKSVEYKFPCPRAKPSRTLGTNFNYDQDELDYRTYAGCTGAVTPLQTTFACRGDSIYAIR